MQLLLLLILSFVSLFLGCQPKETHQVEPQDVAQEKMREDREEVGESPSPAAENTPAVQDTTTPKEPKSEVSSSPEARTYTYYLSLDEYLTPPFVLHLNGETIAEVDPLHIDPLKLSFEETFWLSEATLTGVFQTTCGPVELPLVPSNFSNRDEESKLREDPSREVFAPLERKPEGVQRIKLWFDTPFEGTDTSLDVRR